MSTLRCVGIPSLPKLCVDQEPVRGTVRRLWWWEQPMDIDLASVGGYDLAEVAGNDIDLGVFAASTWLK